MYLLALDWTTWCNSTKTLRTSVSPAEIWTGYIPNEGTQAMPLPKPVRSYKEHVILAMGWDYDYMELRSLKAVVRPKNIWVNVEQRWNDTERGKQKNSQESVSLCHSVHQKSHMDCPGREPDPLPVRNWRLTAKSIARLCSVLLSWKQCARTKNVRWKQFTRTNWLNVFVW
jgi:hypothetical protein